MAIDLIISMVLFRGISFQEGYRKNRKDRAGCISRVPKNR